MRGDEQFQRAYNRIVSLQAWRSELLEDHLPDEVSQFVLEGQNDLLVSYICARTGQWRAALQSQRAAIESYFNALYFMDHPVELQLWTKGKFKTRFTENLKYLECHPALLGCDKRVTGLDILKKEYATHSLAVHGSAKAFRMTTANGPKYFSIDDADKARWVTRNRLVIRGLNLLLIAIFRESIAATKKRNLRESIALSLQSKDRDWIKECYAVTIPFD